MRERLARLLLVATIWLVPGLAGCDAAAPIEFRADALAEGVRLYRPTDGGANTLVVERADGLLLVDAQPDPERARALLAAVRADTKAAVRYVIISHPHREAAGGVSAFGDALVIAAADAAAAMAEDGYGYAAELGDDGERPRPTLLVRGEIRLDDERHPVRIQPGFSGHARGELLVSLRGDTLIHAGGLPFADRNPYCGGCSVTRWLGGLNRLSRDKPEAVVGTRGPALTVAELRERRDALAWLRAQTQESFLRGTPWDAMGADVAGLPEAAEHFDTSAEPSFLETMATQAAEELRDQRRKRGLD